MPIIRKNANLLSVPSENPADFKEMYMQDGEDLREAFAYFLGQMIVSPSTDLTSDKRQDIIDFYSQVMHFFAHPGSPEILMVVKQLELDIRNNMPKGFKKDISWLQTCQYGEYEYTLWPITEAKMIDSLNLDHCLAKVLIQALRSIGFNQDNDDKHYAVPQLLGIIPSKFVEDLLGKGIWFKEFTAVPEGDTATHGGWSHCLQIYFIIQLVKMGMIKIAGQMTLPELLKACVIPLKEPTDALRNIFDLVFEQRNQFEVIETIAKGNREQSKNQSHTSLFSNKNVQPIATKLDALIHQFPYSYYSLCSPAFLSSYLGIIHRYIKTDLSCLTMLWVHKLAKLNFKSIERKLPEEVNQYNLTSDPERVLAILNSKKFFFAFSDLQPDLSKVDRSKFDQYHYQDAEQQRAIFYRKK